MLAALDETALAPALGRRPVRFRHDLGARPELALDRLAAVVDSLPPRWVFAHRAQDDPHEGRGCETAVDRHDLGATIRSIGTAHASIRVYNLERTVEYHDVARELEARVRALVGPVEGGLHAVNLGMFVASPGTVTPAHPDRHHNLLLQLRGTREVWIEDDPDPRRHHLRVLDYLECPPMGMRVLPPAARQVLGPGDAVYIPPYAFHWTRLAGEPGVALSIGCSTAATLRASDVVDFDLRLRRHGRRPRPAAPGSVTGRAKARLERMRRGRRNAAPSR